MKKNIHRLFILIFSLLIIYSNSYALSTPPNGSCDKVITFTQSHTSNYISSNYSFKLSGEYTVSGWFKTSTTNQSLVFIYREFYSSQEAFNVQINTEGKLSSLHNINVFAKATAVSKTIVNDNIWHHYAITKTADSLIMYLDGKKEDAKLMAEGLNATLNYKLEIGRTNINWLSFAGSIDEFSIFRRALTPTEVVNTMQNQLNGNETNLLLYYNFNESAEDEVIVDKSSSKNNASFNNFSTFKRELIDIGNCTITQSFPPNSNCSAVIKLDGVDDQIATNIPSSNFLDRDFTIEAWIYIQDYSSSTASVIMSNRKENEGLLFYVAGKTAYNSKKGRLCFQVGGSGISSRDHFGNTFLSAGQWHHVAAVYDFKGKDANYLTLYVDGKVDGVFTNALDIKSVYINKVPAGNLYLGFEEKSTAPKEYHFNGMMDEVKLWGALKTELEINSTMNTSFTTQQANLLATFSMNEGNQSSKILDLNNFTSPQSNFEGALQNMQNQDPFVKSDGSPFLSNTFKEITLIRCDTYLSPSGVLINATGNYTDILSNNTGCDSIIRVNLTINKSPVNTLFINGTTLKSKAPQLDLIYEWTNCDNPSLGILGTAREYTVPTTGSYQVKIINGVCEVQSACTKVMVTSLPDAQEIFPNINVFPNPVVDMFTVDLGNKYQDVHFAIYSTSGTKIYENKFDFTDKITCSLKGNSGIYLIEIQAQNSAKAYLKLVKN